MFRIKTITEPQGSRSQVTVEETDASSVPTGREWTEPFDVLKKDWVELKGRFKKRIQADNAKDVVITTLVGEANAANLTGIT